MGQKGVQKGVSLLDLHHPQAHQMDFTGCHMETLFLALLGTLGGPAMGPHMATQAIWGHMLQIGVQKGVSLLDLHHPQVASNGFHGCHMETLF